MHEQPSTGRIMCNSSDPRNLRSAILQDLFYGIFFAVERGLADVECDFEQAGRRAGFLGGVENARTGGQDLRQTSSPDCTLAINHQVVEATLCEG